MLFKFKIMFFLFFRSVDVLHAFDHFQEDSITGEPSLSEKQIPSISPITPEEDKTYRQNFIKDPKKNEIDTTAILKELLKLDTDNNKKIIDWLIRNISDNDETAQERVYSFISKKNYSKFGIFDKERSTTFIKKYLLQNKDWANTEAKKDKITPKEQLVSLNQSVLVACFREKQAVTNQDDAETQCMLAQKFIKEKNFVEARKCLGIAAKQGHVEAQFNLGVLCKRQEDNEEAEKWFLAVVNQPHIHTQFQALAQCNLGKLYEEKQKYKEAEEYFQKAANNDNVEAQFKIGARFFEKKAIKKAKVWLEKAANHGHILAQYNLGVLYEEEKEHKKAKKWYYEAAKQGCAPAQFNLGLLYEKGKKYKKAKVWYEKAAKQGHTNGQFNLGILLESEKNFKESKKWLQEAAKRGHRGAQNNLGRLYLSQGKYQEAEKWLKQAVNQGEIYAQQNLAVLYLRSGKKREAEELLIELSSKNFDLSMLCLAFIYMESNNIDQLNKSLFWLEKAKNQGNKIAERSIKIVQKSLAKLSDKEEKKLEQNIQKLCVDLQNELQKSQEPTKELALPQEDPHKITIIDPLIDSFLDTRTDTLEDKEPPLVNNNFVEEKADKEYEKFLHIKNTKYLRERMKQLGKIRKEQEKQEERKNLSRQEYFLSDNNRLTVRDIKNKQQKKVTLNSMMKLFEDDYFNGKVILDNTKKGILIHAKKVNGDYISLKNGSNQSHNNIIISTHTYHKGMDGYDEAFLGDLYKLLKELGVDVEN